MSGAHFHYLPVVESICVGQNGLRVSLLQHVFQVAEYDTPVQAKLICVSRDDLLVALGDSYNLNVRAVQRALKEALNMPMNQPGDGDTKRRSPVNLGVSQRNHHK